MKKQLIIITVVELLELCALLVGFLSSVAYKTLGLNWIDIYDLSSFSGVIYWSIISIFSIVGLVISIYTIVTNQIPKEKIMGFVLGILGFILPIVFSFFLIIPATVIILAVIFNLLINKI